MNYRRLTSLFVCVPILLGSISFAQDSEDDEVFELSPFQISSDHGYRSQSKVRTEPIVTMNDIGATIDGVIGPGDPKLIRASGVRVGFAIGFYDDEESVRRETLNKLMGEVRSLIATHEDLHFEPGKILIPEGDRKRGRTSRRSAYTSYAHFDVSFEFGDGASPFSRVLEIRQIVEGLSIRNDVTKIFFGKANIMDKVEHYSLLNGVGRHYVGYSEIDALGAVVPFVTDDLSRQLPMSTPEVAITLLKRADRVRIEFSLEVEDAIEAKRLQRLQAALEKAQAAVGLESGLAFETSTVNLAKGDGGLKHARNDSCYFAQALFNVTFELANDSVGLEPVRLIREKLYGLDWEGVRLRFGVAALVLENPDRYRGEILQTVFSDLKTLDDGLGEYFEVEPKIENVRVKIRHASPTEVELWIPYSYEIVSVREREHQKALFELELEKARAASLAGNACCEVTDKS